jgi:hypothetical protein
MKLKDLILEKKELNPRFIKDVAKMTQKNNHTLARFQLAKYMGNKKLSKYYAAVEQLNDVFYGGTPELSKLNAKMEKELYRELVRTYSNYEEIYKAL